MLGIDEASVQKALSRISADICESKPVEEYKQLFSSFVERVDVFEDYVTIVLKVFDMINARVCNGSGVIKDEPPLDLHQMVVWNGGASATRGEHLICSEILLNADESRTSSGIFSNSTPRFPPLSMSV